MENSIKNWVGSDEDQAAIDQDNRNKWNAVHEIRHPGALSGSNGGETLKQHCLMNLMRPKMHVLDIGVGLGGMAEHLHALRCHVDCLDVADKAKETVKDFIENFYLAANIQDLPSLYYDVAISHLVAQHMCERNLRKQIEHVFRSLKPGGIFSLHLAGATEGPLNNLTCEIPSGMDGAMCRDPDYSFAMIADVLKTGYMAKLVGKRMDWPQFKSYWYFVHIIKE